MRGRPEGAWIGHAHGPRQAEPGGPHDGERGRGPQQARAVTRPYRGRARLPRLVSCRLGAFRMWRGTPSGEGAVWIADGTSRDMHSHPKGEGSRPGGVAGRRSNGDQGGVEKATTAV